MTRIERVELAGWKSIHNATLDLRPLNVLIGPNGAGKSNLVSFLSFLPSLFTGEEQQYVARAGGANTLLHYGAARTRHISASLSYSADHWRGTFETCLEHQEPDKLVVNPYPPDLAQAKPGETLANVSGAAGRIAGWVRAVPGVAVPRELPLPLAIRSYHFRDTSTTAAVRLTGYLRDNHMLLPNASNLAAMLYLYREKHSAVYRRILSTIRKIVPGFRDFQLAPERLNPDTILLNWRQHGHDYLFGPHQLSDGSLRAAALITLLLQPEKDLPALLIIDEPELGLHPLALEVVAGLTRAVSVRCQILLATQSPAFLDLFDPDEIMVAETVNGASLFRRLDRVELADWLRRYTVSELWEKNVIGGGPLS